MRLTTVREPSMKVGWRDAPLALRDVALSNMHNTKITDIENKLDNHNLDKYIATPEFNTLAADVFNARLA